jgi:hypothetical protein
MTGKRRRQEKRQARRPTPLRTGWIAAMAWSGVAFGALPSNMAAAADFPGVGHKFVADFTQFRFEQIYPSESSLQYTALNLDGTRGASQTVDVHVQPAGDALFIVTWQEANKTTVVQVQDYAKKHIYTHLTLPDGTFLKLQGSFVPAD